MVEITVSWNDDRQEYMLLSLLGEPERPTPLTLTVEPTSGSPPTLARDTTADFEVRAFDADGVEVNDCSFRWEVKPGDTNGALVVHRPTDTATFSHQILIPNMPNLYTAGPAVVQANVTYNGVVYEGESAPFTLLP
jgi:hypothetical protein